LLAILALSLAALASLFDVFGHERRSSPKFVVLFLILFW